MFSFLKDTFMVTSTASFSNVLRQILSDSAPSSKGKGKGKAKQHPANILSAPLESKKDWQKSVEEFCQLVEKYDNKSAGRISLRSAFL